MLCFWRYLDRVPSLSPTAMMNYLPPNVLRLAPAFLIGYFSAKAEQHLLHKSVPR